MRPAFPAKVFEGLTILRRYISHRWRSIPRTAGTDAVLIAEKVEAALVVAAQLPPTRTEVAAVTRVQDRQNGQASMTDITRANSANVQVNDPGPTDDDTVVATTREHGRCLRDDASRDFGVVTFCVLSRRSADVAGEACGEGRQSGEQKVGASFDHLSQVSARSMAVSSSSRSLCKRKETS